MKKVISLLAFSVLTSAICILYGNWQTLPDAKINFTIDGLFGADVKGTISDLKSTIRFYPDDVPRSSITTAIRPATINTGNKKRDNHLKTIDFLEVEKYSSISFISKSFRQIGEYYVVEGDLTLKDVTKPITIPFEFINYGDSAVFRGDFNINRLDYHVGKRSHFMGNEVRIHLDIAVKKSLD